MAGNLPKGFLTPVLAIVLIVSLISPACGQGPSDPMSKSGVIVTPASGSKITGTGGAAASAAGSPMKDGMRAYTGVFMYGLLGRGLDSSHRVIQQMAPIIFSILIPLYVFLILLTGIYFIYGASSASIRAHTKNQLIKLIIGMIACSLSLVFFDMLIKMNNFVADQILRTKLIPDPAGKLTWDPMKNMGSATGGATATLGLLVIVALLTGVGGALLGPIICMIFSLVLLPYLVVFIRYELVLVFGMLFPFTMFCQSFEFLKGLGNKLMKQTLTWIFLSVPMSVFVVLTVALAEASLKAPTVFEQQAMQIAAMAAYVLVGMSPIMIGGMLGAVGGSFAYVGTTMGNPRLVFIGGVLQGQSSSALTSAAARAQSMEARSQTARDSAAGYNEGIPKIGSGPPPGADASQPAPPYSSSYGAAESDVLNRGLGSGGGGGGAGGGGPSGSPSSGGGGGPSGSPSSGGKGGGKEGVARTRGGSSGVSGEGPMVYNTGLFGRGERRVGEASGGLIGKGGVFGMIGDVARGEGLGFRERVNRAFFGKPVAAGTNLSQMSAQQYAGLRFATAKGLGGKIGWAAAGLISGLPINPKRLMAPAGYFLRGMLRQSIGDYPVGKTLTNLSYKMTGWWEKDEATGRSYFNYGWQSFAGIGRDLSTSAGRMYKEYDANKKGAPPMVKAGLIGAGLTLPIALMALPIAAPVGLGIMAVVAGGMMLGARVLAPVGQAMSEDQEPMSKLKSTAEGRRSAARTLARATPLGGTLDRNGVATSLSPGELAAFGYDKKLEDDAKKKEADAAANPTDAKKTAAAAEARTKADANKSQAVDKAKKFYDDAVVPTLDRDAIWAGLTDKEKKNLGWDGTSADNLRNKRAKEKAANEHLEANLLDKDDVWKALSDREKRGFGWVGDVGATTEAEASKAAYTDKAKERAFNHYSSRLSAEEGTSAEAGFGGLNPALQNLYATPPITPGGGTQTWDQRLQEARDAPAKAKAQLAKAQDDMAKDEDGRKKGFESLGYWKTSSTARKTMLAKPGKLGEYMAAMDAELSADYKKATGSDWSTASKTQREQHARKYFAKTTATKSNWDQFTDGEKKFFGFDKAAHEGKIKSAEDALKSADGSAARVFKEREAAMGAGRTRQGNAEDNWGRLSEADKKKYLGQAEEGILDGRLGRGVSPNVRNVEDYARFLAYDDTVKDVWGGGRSVPGADPTTPSFPPVDAAKQESYLRDSVWGSFSDKERKEKIQAAGGNEDAAKGAALAAVDRTKPEFQIHEHRAMNAAAADYTKAQKQEDQRKAEAARSGGKFDWGLDMQPEDKDKARRVWRDQQNIPANTPLSPEEEGKCADWFNGMTHDERQHVLHGKDESATEFGPKSSAYVQKHQDVTNNLDNNGYVIDKPELDPDKPTVIASPNSTQADGKPAPAYFLYGSGDIAVADNPAGKNRRKLDPKSAEYAAVSKWHNDNLSKKLDAAPSPDTNPDFKTKMDACVPRVMGSELGKGTDIGGIPLAQKTPVWQLLDRMNEDEGLLKRVEGNDPTLPTLTTAEKIRAQSYSRTRQQQREGLARNIGGLMNQPGERRLFGPKNEEDSNERILDYFLERRKTMPKGAPP